MIQIKMQWFEGDQIIPFSPKMKPIQKTRVEITVRKTEERPGTAVAPSWHEIVALRFARRAGVVRSSRAFIMTKLVVVQ